jgi:predicted RNA-binding Zn-ribbon protein involved in translation (DUF1610 family)
MGDLEYVIIAILIALLCLILFLEWKFMRSRFKRKKKGSDLLDRAYNDVRTTENILNMLKRDGIDTSAAQPYLTEAKAALSRQDHHSCIEYAEKAKFTLKKAKTQANLKPFWDEPSDERGIEKAKGEEVSPDSNLQENYMQSKFTISLAEDTIQTASKKGKDISKAQEFLKLSTEAFENGVYSEALKLALRSKKCAEGLEEEGGIIELSVSSESDEYKCPNCGESINTNDIFCRKCGAKIERELSCPNCGESINTNDIFCGKCGEKIK